MASSGEKVATAVNIPNIKMEPTVSEAAMRLARRAEIILEKTEFSRSRAITLRGALARGALYIAPFAGFFF
jgi:hypothetical protein